MRVLMATDLHGAGRVLDAIPAAVREHRADLFLAVGDITDFGRPRGYAKDLIGRVPVPTLAVPGNCDPPSVMRELDGLGVDLHMRKTMIQGLTFVGLGGANPTPFGTPFELSEEEIGRTLDRTMERGAILVSHAPPNGFVDVVRSGEHVGSVAVRRIVEEFRPPLVLCGHIHEGRGVAELGPTTIVNPGPAIEGCSALVDLDGDARVRLL